MTQAQSFAEARPRKKNRRQRRQDARAARSSATPKASTGIQSLIAEAGRHHVAGRLAQADTLYRRVLSANPEEPLALARLGALCVQTQRNGEAIELLERALAVEPGDAPSQVNLSIALAAEGQLERADEAMRAARRIAPRDPETQKNYGAWCQRRGRLEEAAEALELGLAGAPEDQARQNLLAQIYVSLRRPEDARRRFEKALELFPDDPELHANFGLALVQQEQGDEALRHLALGFPKAGESLAYQLIFTRILGEADPYQFGPELEPPMHYFLDGALVDCQKLSPAIGSRLWLKFMQDARIEEVGNGKTRKMHMDGILKDPLLLKLLRNVVNVSVALESILVPLRRTLLQTARKEQALSTAAMEFMASFAMQCHNNSYLFPVSEEELAEVERLGGEIEARIAAKDALDATYETAVALFAMYRPIHQLSGFEALVALPVETWSAELRPLIQRALINPTIEQRLKPTIPSFGSIDDDVSQAVRSQYEDNPYPRWISMPPSEHFTLAGYIEYGTRWIKAEANDDESDLTALIAGSGTGRHPIACAMALPQARVTAIDLSLSSLAYAKRMAEGYGVQNLEFLHGDLLDVAELGRDFPLIESAGVLHHMEDPERGLESLVRILRPGGHLRLGLYSKIARRRVTEARARIEEMALSPTPDAIRAFRRRITDGSEPGLKEMVRWSDFFDLDSFRDLVFHVQEHQFTLLQIKDLLARQGLEFLGFANLAAKQYEAFSERFPEESKRSDLECWATYEEAFPDTFLSMYQFWCRKPA